MSDESPRRTPFFATSLGLVVAGLLCCVISAGLAAGAVILLHQVSFNNEVAEIVVSYLVFAPATLAAALALVLLIVGSVRWANFGRGTAGPESSAGSPQVALLETIAERLLLSETAKRVAYRHEDIKSLRETIRDDIEKGDYDAAMVLVNELSQTYGYKEEAEQFRDRIVQARNDEMESKVTAALGRLRQLVQRHQFDEAVAEAKKIQRLYPDSPRTGDLMKRVIQARQQYKHDLEREFLQASERDDVDAAMKLMKEMDKYLTEQEAEPFRETARGVIGKARDNLGVQFKLAVQDKQWLAGVRVGEQIIRQFPNSRMADEVRGMLDLLRERAASEQAATAG